MLPPRHALSLVDQDLVHMTVFSAINALAHIGLALFIDLFYIVLDNYDLAKTLIHIGIGHDPSRRGIDRRAFAAGKIDPAVKGFPAGKRVSALAETRRKPSGSLADW